LNSSNHRREIMGLDLMSGRVWKISVRGCNREAPISTTLILQSSGAGGCSGAGKAAQ
jgi:hypothetical protein